MPSMPRVQSIVLPILRGHPDLLDKVSVLPALAGVNVGTWNEDVDYREFPMITIRRIGGVRNELRPKLLARPVIEMTAYGIEGLAETEDLYEDALEALYDAQRKQTMTEFGYVHSIKETLGATQFSSLFQDSWRIQGLIALGIRPPRSTN